MKYLNHEQMREVSVQLEIEMYARMLDNSQWIEGRHARQMFPFKKRHDDHQSCEKNIDLSVQSVVEKIMSLVYVLDRLEEYTELQIEDEICNFRQDKPLQIGSLEVEQLCENTKENRMGLLAFTYLDKAYDKGNREILSEVLENYGIG